MGFFDFLKTVKIPGKYAWYEEACSKKERTKKDLSETRFVVLDTETTGLNPKTDRILSIGAVAVINDQILLEDCFESYLKQEAFNNDSIAIHEITPGESSKADNPKQAMEDFIEFLGGAILIGHNIQFDFQILSNACQRQLGFPLLNKSYDTVDLLKRTEDHFAFPEKYKGADLGLDSLCDRFHIPMHDRHTAMGDAMATAILFSRQLKKLRKREVNHVRDLLR